MWTARFYVALMMTLASAWAGQEIKEGPGEIVVPDEIVLRLKPGATLTGVLGSLNLTATLVASSTTMPIQVIRVPAPLRQTVSTILANHPEIEYVEPHRIRTSTDLTPNDTSFTAQWWLTRTQAAAAWSLLPGRLAGSVPAASRVRVAILDTGADCTHPDFMDTVGATTDPSGVSHFASALSTAIVPTTIATPACAWQDDHGHGTHVAGILAAATNNGKGVASVGFPSQLMIYKVMDRTGYGSDFGIANAITMAADAGARIISMSLGGPGYSQMLQDAVDYAWARNVLVVAAAGNSNTATLFYPAGANYVLGVGATDSSDTRASFSNFGFGLDVMAPGVNILSTYPGNRYGSMSGTSMATPIVSAVASLIAASTTDLASDALAQRIEQSAESKSATGAWDQYYGYGRVNAHRGLSGVRRATTTGGLSGQVVSASGAPVNGAQVRMGGVLITTPSTGLFRFGNMAAGASALTVSYGGNPTWSYNVVIPAGADSSLRVKLGVPTGAFTGSVTSNGAAIEGAVVQALQAGLVQASAVTDANGQFTLPVAAGSYDLRSTALGHAAYMVGAQAIAGGGSVFVAMPMLPLGQVTGTVVDADGVPLVRAQITLESPTFSTGAVTNSLGEYTSLGMPAGAYSVTAVSTGYTASVLDGVAVSDGGATVANFQLTGGVGLTTLTLAKATALGGEVVAGNRVALGSPAGPAGAVVLLSSSNPAAAQLPASVTIPAGATQSPLFSITTSAVQAQVPVVVSATFGSVTKTSTLTVTAPIAGIAALTISPQTIIGGKSITAASVTLVSAAPAGGAVVSLTSADPAVIPPAAGVTVAAGALSASFTLTTGIVTVSKPVLVTASYGGATKSVTVTVNPIALSAFTLNAASVSGGKPLTATVTLNGPAPAAGAVVTFTSNGPSATPPASVTVPAGATVATLTVPTASSNLAASVVLSATYGGVSKTATVSITPVTLYALAISPTPLSGGKILTNARLTLSGPAPAAGAVVTFASSNPAAAIPPATVMVASGASTAAFSIPTAQVTAATPVVITASYGGVERTATVNVKPPAVYALSISAVPISGGKAVPNAVVTLDGPAPAAGAVVSLASSNPSAATPPMSVSVSPGATVLSFAIPTGFVNVATPVVISASYGGATKSSTINVKPTALYALAASTTPLTGGKVIPNATVTLDGPAPPAGGVVTFTSSNPAVAKPPVSVTVASGATASSYFAITTSSVTSVTPVVITASYGGVSKSVTLTVKPVALLSFFASPLAIKGGGSIGTAKVTLDGPAPAGGVAITISSSNPAAQPPATVTVAAGATVVSFAIPTKPVAATTTAAVTAAYGSVSMSVNVTVNP